MREGFSDQLALGTYGPFLLTSLFVRFRILRTVISADDLSVCWYRGARHSFSPVDLVIVCTVLVLDTFLRPVAFAPLSVFVGFYSLFLYKLTTYHVTTH